MEIESHVQSELELPENKKKDMMELPVQAKWKLISQKSNSKTNLKEEANVLIFYDFSNNRKMLLTSATL